VETAEHVAIVEREGRALAAVAERTPVDATIPTCPGWNVRDLLRHVGGIHRWATAHVSGARQGPFDPFAELEGAWPDDAMLIDWFRHGHAGLVQALRTASPDTRCFTFLPAPSPLAFWARRQAHETGMHRVDLEGATGAITTFEVDQAIDGIEELLFGFMARPGQRLRTDEPRTIALRAVDADAAWQVTVGPEEPQVQRDGPGADADCQVAASASDLFRLVWNRRSLDGLDASGDTKLFDLWRETVFVRWR
jgi:uncharacterized protein (TIGR03083 family)